jgi:hypothetical protein
MKMESFGLATRRLLHQEACRPGDALNVRRIMASQPNAAVA